MRIIIKFILRNIKENKIRTFLILFSITLSVALFFASMAISDTVTQMYAGQLRSRFGSAEIRIYPTQESPSSFLRLNRAKSLEDRMEYIVGTVRNWGTYRHNQRERLDIALHGYHLDDLAMMNPINIEEGVGLDDFSGRKAIIGREDARRYGLKLGDSMEVELYGSRYNFIVSGIATSRGLFRPNNSNIITAVVLRETLASFNDARGMVTEIYLKTRDGVDVKETIEEIAEIYRRYGVSETITEGEIGEFIRSITSTFMLMLILVIFISIFIIYTAFKVITMERLPMIGTFRSIGATKKVTDFILLLESIIYGVIGGVFGCGLGLVILYGMTRVLSNDAFSGLTMEAQMVYSTTQLIGAFFNGV